MATQVETPEASTEPLVGISTEELIVGRTIEFPVFDQNGVLLLSEGSQITSRFKELLRERDMDEIEVHPDDASRLILNLDAVNQDDLVSFNTEITGKLDKLIDSGSLFVANTGDAVRDKMVIHGCKAYNKEQRQSLIKQHQTSGESLDNMMKQAMHNGCDGTSISNVAKLYLTSLTEDSDCVLTTAAKASQDESIANHCLQMSILAMSIGIEMELDEQNVRNIGLAGLVHDWGMARVPEEIRHAKRILNESDYLAIKRHPIYSLEMLEKVSGIPSVIPLICYQVHERMNGTGYPRERAGAQIHQFARILHVADAYIALTSKRPFRKALMPYFAMECLLKQARDKIVDADVVRALLHILSLFPIGTFVTLTDGSVAHVLRRNGMNYTSPIVLLLQDSTGKAYDTKNPSSIINLAESELSIQQALPTPNKDEIRLTDDLLCLQR